MSKLPKFVQIHSLHSYPAALLNRDDSGLAKRLGYGGATRTRISSQCLKRHWRKFEGDESFNDMQGFVDAYRSREVVTKRVLEPIFAQYELDDDMKQVLASGFQKGVYGDKKGEDKKGRQPLMLGAPEVDFLKAEAERIVKESDNKKSLTESVAAFFKDNKKNMSALRENTQMPGGLASALFGRMVTADPAANIDAAIHVAHAFTVHAEESENDYFSVVDDLSEGDDDAGADHIGDMELTAGLFYGYVVIDLPTLVSNVEGIDAKEWASADVDRTLPAEIVSRLVNSIGTVSPGAKLGSTAPYSWASFMMVETGNRQPRSLADAFRKPVKPTLKAALRSLKNQLVSFDDNYGKGEERQFLSVKNIDLDGAAKVDLTTMRDSLRSTIIGSGS